MASFWHHLSAEELAREQGIIGPQRIEDLSSDLEWTDEEVEAFYRAGATLDDPA